MQGHFNFIASRLLPAAIALSLLSACGASDTVSSEPDSSSQLDGSDLSLADDTGTDSTGSVNPAPPPVVDDVPDPYTPWLFYTYNVADYVSDPDDDTPDSMPLCDTINGAAHWSSFFNWERPQQRTDGTQLTFDQIAGYRLLYGPQPGYYQNEIYIDDAAAQSYLIDYLTCSSYVVTVTAIDTDGRESLLAAEKTILRP